MQHNEGITGAAHVAALPAMNNARSIEEAGTSGSIMLADCDLVVRQALALRFERLGLTPLQAQTVKDCLSQLDRAPVLGAVIEERLIDGSGFELLAAIKARNTLARVVFLTSYPSIAGAVRAIREGADDYFPKPAAEDYVAAAVLSPLRTLYLGCDMSSSPTLERVQWEYMTRIVADCHGNVTKAARALGLHRRTLQRKLSRHAPK